MTDGKRRRPTLDDVAALVGVSRATVSNAYNRPDQLSARLREEVLRAARQLGYPGPNPTARSLATRRAGAIAFMLDTGLSAAFSDPALSITLDALASRVDPEGHALLLLPGGDDGGPRAERVLSAQVDLAVAYSLADGAPALRAVRDRRLPLVVIDHPMVPGSARVGIDDRGGAAAAARHLVELGHRRFGIVSAQCLSTPREGPLTVDEALRSRFRDNRERLTGYLEVLAAAGVPAGSVPVWETSGLSREQAMGAVRAVLDREPRPSALLCMSDELAVAALTVARERGLAVPRDLSVVGFDDTPPVRWTEPPLTTVRQDLTRKGEIAGELALRLLAGARPPRATTLDVELVVRESAGPAPS
ncbi:DNA-binding transcriptional regulator, LacI/PurR family [Amycolatopsis arida]|uniref:DNA-binding transcriptional regulator, LacI/PurR family n=1 Tax=Amycolatopsis arida TaxID=587909 RepID=A0A1I5ULH3_9PSEU|nr:LacI family DNA-binding transcriptional regulator [Amycolatopsis arida]TDX90933.1 DNA-binding LacI/PurR family transcriptional regulator [Amycolatopsis arida]SFP95907.1 DNA-binding transcriptional regulator, LacI/PurR family [Amycolatopsis arida]